MGVPRAAAVLVLALTQLSNCVLERDDSRIHLDAALNHYETLHTHHFKHTVTPHPSLGHQRHIEFHTLNRHFHLSLVPHRKLFSPTFVALSVGTSNKERYHALNLDEFYRGSVHGDNGSRVIAHVDDRGILSAAIETSSDIYHIEPSLYIVKGPHPFHMVAYRSSDMKQRLDKTMLDYVTGPFLPPNHHDDPSNVFGPNSLSSSPAVEPAEHQFSEDGMTGFDWQGHTHRRLRRQNVGRLVGDSCGMILVADYKFYEFTDGGRNDNETEINVMRKLIILIAALDDLTYRRSEFTPDSSGTIITGVGLEISKVMIYSSPATTGDPATLFNSIAQGNPDANMLLRNFNNGPWENYCLAHLFTHRNFQSGLLGLANIASPVDRETGGICSRQFSDTDRDDANGNPATIIYNTGLSTFTTGGRLLLFAEQRLVTAHEIGHNWGSHHDPFDVPTCRENYLMHAFAQDGSRTTHEMFSSCSRGSIGIVLASKGGCFVDRGPICGNFRVEENEQCDAGQGDSCCDASCRLLPGAVCSDFNEPCCDNCQLANSSLVCDIVGDVSFNCRDSSFCNGTSSSCPERPAAPLDSPCIGGECRLVNGDVQCIPICELVNKTACVCAGNAECMVCCTDSDGNCMPQDSLLRSNGSSCSIGVCLEGECVRQFQDTISRIWNIFLSGDINAIGELVKTNIVGVVLIVMTLFWIPVVVVIHFLIDRQIWRRFVRSGGKRGVRSYIDNVRNSATRRSLYERRPNIHTSREKPALPVDPVDDSALSPNYSGVGPEPMPLLPTSYSGMGSEVRPLLPSRVSPEPMPVAGQW